MKFSIDFHCIRGLFTASALFSASVMADGCGGSQPAAGATPNTFNFTDEVDTDLTDGVFLAEAEPLHELDPAIFTDVRPYLSEDISIRLPGDQLPDGDGDGQEKTDTDEIKVDEKERKVDKRYPR